MGPGGPLARRLFQIPPGPAPAPATQGASLMGKGNHSQKNDKKNKKPKQDKTKAAVKK